MLSKLYLWPIKFMQLLADPPDLIAGRSQASWSDKTLHEAICTIGWGEAGRNNAGPELEVLRRGHRAGRAEAWCAAAVSYWIEEGWARSLGASSWDDLSLDDRDRCPVKRSHGARQLFRRIAKAGRIVPMDEAVPGDFVLWDRGVPGRPETSWQAHIGILHTTSHPPIQSVTTWRHVAGNEGRYPAKVRIHPFRTARLAGIARLPGVKK